MKKSQRDLLEKSLPNLFNSCSIPSGHLDQTRIDRNIGSSSRHFMGRLFLRRGCNINGLN